jgi:hypothetical protein
MTAPCLACLGPIFGGLPLTTMPMRLHRCPIKFNTSSWRFGAFHVGMRQLSKTPLLSTYKRRLSPLSLASPQGGRATPQELHSKVKGPWCRLGGLEGVNRPTKIQFKRKLKLRTALPPFEGALPSYDRESNTAQTWWRCTRDIQWRSYKILAQNSVRTEGGTAGLRRDFKLNSNIN